MLKDPLVVHFDGPLGELRDARFTFDLNADGHTEAMPFVGQGSGFLVLDRNANGRAWTTGPMPCSKGSRCGAWTQQAPPGCNACDRRAWARCTGVYLSHTGQAEWVQQVNLVA